MKLTKEIINSLSKEELLELLRLFSKEELIEMIVKCNKDITVTFEVKPKPRGIVDDNLFKF